MLGPTGFTAFISYTVLLIVQSSYGSEIIGGKEVKPHSMPFMALLETNQPACGGILISPSWVLTAAHCIKVKKVLLGVHSIKDKKNKFRQVRKIKKHLPHPGYDATSKRNDLMLLKLDKVKETTEVKWLTLGKTVEDPKAGTKCVVAGWGKTDTGEVSDVLMSATVTVIDRKTCNSPEYYNRKPNITSEMVCAGSGDNSSADTCQGDSGGPLLCNGALVGVTSFGRGCGKPKYPGVYAFLTAKQLNWLKNTIKP